MTSPIETIADALIAFILSLLRDPDAADGFAAAPQAMLTENGLDDVCLADIAAVRPVIVDHPAVIPNPGPDPSPPPPDPASPTSVVDHIVRMVQQYTTVDARTTIFDQSVSQSIWTEGGDVTQVFDQEAVVASGDGAIAAGDDVAVVDSDVDVSMGDVSVGNETNEGSFNQTGEDAADEAQAAPADAVEPTDATDSSGDADSTDAGSATAAVAQAVDTVAPGTQPPVSAAATPADVPEPADLLESDLTAGEGETYDADAAGAALDDQPVEAPLEDD